ncbi:DUF411 domain-containing protein [Oceanibacterium hippocampi]|uniref:Metal-binding protein n=1 Tax=Oceanibacterium hippocampi TaxID=745714 RepID=A0A1Y5TIR3_9PROT|nr:DUF411 domain-containing protein [Oceanibacterium hippocampi]SLN64599.1 hypothetical protein OCH7691_02930 [Oceanibacterium hippocampi]
MHKTIMAIVAIALAGTAYLTIGRPALAEDVTLYKTPQCGCCEDYADYLRENGFTVTVKPTENLTAMSRAAGIPDAFQGCHLALVDGYAVSGHVPVETVNRLLEERPDIKGVTLPGMPMGSPGMSGTKTEPFTIYAIGDGRPQLYSVE